MNRIRGHVIYPKVARQEPALVRRKNEWTEARIWQPHEDNMLRRSYRALGSKALSAELGRPYRSIQDRARVLGVARSRA